ncbi:S-adenosyl-L-methionine-dependent methyltransferases superfamily protein [Striga hermonthica]|uniref:S-adenosyl-L-methionine-dependent methyltransferases superfamily protein n=1 Tax=Striga hermonthica TaxID=68872 RepID=A0A9N7MYH7_STRHE|nr:S-adenosyl-L-methionine-dependent methyltransferases superfamily protein [Striga hermonthica]
MKTNYTVVNSENWFRNPSQNPKQHWQGNTQSSRSAIGKMEKKVNHPQKATKENSNRRGKKQEELLKTLGDFTSKENWDQFFTIRGSDDSFEWYAEWPQLRSLLTSGLLAQSEPLKAAAVNILVPGCGNSRLSEHLYDAGFTNITNVDFSKVVISDMLRRNVRDRPGMKWRVMDMTSMQFANAAFDAILDKGGLDALMEPEHGPKLGNQYLSEVKRLLKDGGKYICLTLAECHVLDLLFPKFRFGWKMSVYAIDQEPSPKSLKLQTFMVVAEKDSSCVISEISSSVDEKSVQSHGDQARQLYEALEREKRVRSEYSSGSDIMYSLEDLNLGTKGDLTELEPGRRIKLTLGEPGVSRFIYNGVLLDAQPDSGAFSYHFGVFIVPKMRAHEWLFSSEEGQWLVVVSSKAARLLMILLDSSNSNAPMEDIQKDLSPLVKQLAPRNCDDGVPIPFMAASDGITQSEIVHQVTSALTGPIMVEDVIYEKIADDLHRQSLSKELLFRRLIFHRSENLVQSEALLAKEGSDGLFTEAENKKVQAVPKTRKKGKHRKSDSNRSASHASSGETKVVHNYLASSYHNGIISGLMLISLHLKGCRSDGGMVRTVVIGLGAGLLPMFMKNCIPSLMIEVVELDPVILDVAREYFGFREDECLKVNITDGIKFVREIAQSDAVDPEGKSLSKVDILIVDVDSSDSSSGLTCPAVDFVEESFLLTVKDSLSERGLFIINLVSRSSTVKGAIYLRLKAVFRNIFHLQLEEDVNEVIFVLKTDSIVNEDQLAEARVSLATMLESEKKEWSQRIIDASKLIKPLSF